MKTTLLVLSAFVGLCFVPVAHAQVTQSASLNSNTLNSTVNIVTLDTGAVGLSVNVATTGTLSCSTYPVITFIVTRNAVNTTLGVITTSNAASWTQAPIFTGLLPQDLIFAKLTTSGIGCSNELPLTVSATYFPQAGLCDANPSACVTLTGTLAGTNGLPASNMTLTFRPTQQAFLGGVPPSNTTSGGGGGGGGSGACEILGVNPGDICYFTGTAWAVLTGNTVTTNLFSENASGLPSWYTPPQTIAAASHKALLSFTASTGLFTNGQLACGDLSNSGTACPINTINSQNVVGTDGSGNLIAGTTSYSQAITDIAPVSGDAILILDSPKATTITGFICGTQSATSAVVDLKPATESAWGTLGSSVLSGTITATPSGASGTITTSALAANTPLMVSVGTVTGSVANLYCKVTYTRGF